MRITKRVELVNIFTIVQSAPTLIKWRKGGNTIAMNDIVTAATYSMIKMDATYKS